jgi:hypothetical protein
VGNALDVVPEGGISHPITGSLQKIQDARADRQSGSASPSPSSIFQAQQRQGRGKMEADKVLATSIKGKSDLRSLNGKISRIPREMQIGQIGLVDVKSALAIKKRA